MFQTPELIMMAVGASRIYRSLADYSMMSDFNLENEKFWTFHGAISTQPPTIVDSNQLSENIAREPQPSPDTFDTGSPTITVTKSVHKFNSFTSSIAELPV